LSQTFQPITNNYTMVIVTNSKAVTEFFQRLVTAPDFVFSAQDLASGPAAVLDVPEYDRTLDATHFDQAHIGAGLAGPGTINPATSVVFNKVGDIFGQGPVASTNAFLSENTEGTSLAWGSFDASTNAPVVYPNGNSIANLQNQVLVQVNPPPPSLPSGTNGTAYPSITFTATGGAFSPPFTWSLAGGSQPMPAGLYWTNSLPGVPNDTIAGTPAGNPTGPNGAPFDFNVQLDDSLGRTVNWNYTIIIYNP